MNPEAVRRCQRIIEVHSRSFALSARFLPPKIRERSVVLYAWCRRADDFVDHYDGDEALQRIAKLRAELDVVYSATETPEDPVLGAFQEVVRLAAIPRAYPDELIAGLQMDAEGFRYESMEPLLQYCYRVAGTVGLMMCHVMGMEDETATRNAVHLGIAMQLTNICRDVAEDWERGRLYVPASLLSPLGLEPLRPRKGEQPPPEVVPALSGAIEVLLNEADRFYRSGDQGLYALSWRCRLSIRVARLAYAAIGGRLHELGLDPLAGRAIVPRGKKAWLTAGALARAARELPPRLAQAAAAGSSRHSPPRKLVNFPQDVLPNEQ